MNRSTPGLPVHHQLLEFTQTHVRQVGDAIQPSHPLSSPSPLASNPSQHQGLFKWVSSSHQVAKVWSFSFSISPSNEHPGLISFRMDWLDRLAVQGTLKSLLQHHSSKASIFQRSAFFTVQLSHPYMTTGKTIALTRWTIAVYQILPILDKKMWDKEEYSGSDGKVWVWALALPAMWDTWVGSLGWEDPLEEGMATHSSILAWRIPWTEERDGLQSMGLQRGMTELPSTAHPQKNYIMPFVAIWMCLEIIASRWQSKPDRKIQIQYDIIYMWNLKYDTNELMANKEQICGC